MIRLYLTPVPEQTTDTATDQIGADIQQSGLLETGGTAVENIATQNVDFRKQGRIQLGPTLSRKVAEELDSLSESSYTTLPLFDAADGSLARKRGYYEIARIDVTPAQEARDDVYQYDVNLTLSGTREDSRRAVRTNPQTIDSVYPDATTPAVVTIPNAATDVRWYDDANGTEPAIPTATVEAEYGTVAQYDPADASFDAPTLTYDLDFEQDGPTDARVYDSRDRVKLAATASGEEANVWTHAYHTGYQFDGAAVIDTGRFRLVLDGDLNATTGWEPRVVESGTTDTIESGTVEVDETLTVEDGGTFVVEDGATHILSEPLRSDITAAEWNDSLEVWNPIQLDTTSPWTLDVWSLTRVRPSRIVLRTRWTDGSSSAVIDAIAERGADGVAWVTPENATTPPQDLIDLLTPTAYETDILAFSSQGLIDRNKRDS